MKSRFLAFVLCAPGLVGAAETNSANPPSRPRNPFLMPFPFLPAHPETPQTTVKVVYYVQFHFSAVAWNHPVKSVKFHANMQFTDHCHNFSEVKVRDRNWHVAEMQRKDGYFNARCIIEAVNDGCRQMEYPVVQYEILFEDGTTYLTPVEEVSLQPASLFQRHRYVDLPDAPAALAEAQRELQEAPDAFATEVWRYVWISYPKPPSGPVFPH